MSTLLQYSQGVYSMDAAPVYHQWKRTNLWRATVRRTLMLNFIDKTA